MAATGYKWDAAWSQCGVEAVVLTTAGVILEVSDEIDLDLTAGCEVAIAATYSDHVKATGGLEIGILGDNNTTWQAQIDIGAGIEMIFTQNATRLFNFSVDPKAYSKFKVNLDWNNTTGSSTVTITVRYKTSNVPVAS